MNEGAITAIPDFFSICGFYPFSITDFSFARIKRAEAEKTV